LSPGEITELSQHLPYLGDLLTFEQFTQLVREGDHLEERRGVSAKASAQRQQLYDRTMAAVEDLCGNSSADVVKRLRCAIRDKAPAEYKEALNSLAALTKKTRTFQIRNALLAKLAQGAPHPAGPVRSREET